MQMGYALPTGQRGKRAECQRLMIAELATTNRWVSNEHSLLSHDVPAYAADGGPSALARLHDALLSEAGGGKLPVALAKGPLLFLPPSPPPPQCMQQYVYVSSAIPPRDAATDLGLQAARHVITSADPLLALRELPTAFPTAAPSLARLPVPPAMRAEAEARIACPGTRGRRG